MIVDNDAAFKCETLVKTAGFLGTGTFVLCIDGMQEVKTC